VELLKINGIGPKAVSSLYDVLGGFDEEDETAKSDSSDSIDGHLNEVAESHLINKDNTTLLPSNNTKDWRRIIKELLTEIVIVPYGSNERRVASKPTALSQRNNSTVSDNNPTDSSVALTVIEKRMDESNAASNVSLNGKNVVVSGSFEMKTSSKVRVLSREEVQEICTRLGTYVYVCI